MRSLSALRIFLATGFLLSGISQAGSAVINALSGSFAAVSNAVASAAPGDTVLIPPGTNSWSGLLNISGITLQGSGIGNTAIRDETPPVGNGSALLQLSVNSSRVTRVTQLKFLRGVTNTFPFKNYNGMIQVYGGAPLWRIDNCQFTYLDAKPIRIGDASYGLIDHCSFLMSNMANCVEVLDTGYGDNSWAQPSTFGTSNSVYIEDNSVFSADGFCAVDVDDGGRCVFRHNTMSGAYFNTHGSETSQRFRSSRQIEVYNNSFNWGGGQPYNNFYTVCDIRGGTAVIFSNTAVGFWSVANVNCYRATDNDVNFIPWYGATGLRGWDSNGPALLTGSASVSTNVLIVTGAGWITNQWVGCTVYNPSNQLCGLVTANSSDTMQFKPSRTSYLQVTFKAGDSITVHKVYQMLDQPGMGKGDLLPPNNGSPTPVWLNETSDPIYIWSNSLSVFYQAPNPVSSHVSSTYPSIVENRDFFNDIRKPGYTPFIYPHPLTLITNAVAATNSVPTLPTNSVPPAPTLAPPTDLNVQGI